MSKIGFYYFNFKSIFCEFQLEEIFSINSINFKKEINLILTISREKYKIAENKNYHQSCSNRHFGKSTYLLEINILYSKFEKLKHCFSTPSRRNDMLRQVSTQLRVDFSLFIPWPNVFYNTPQWAKTREKIHFFRKIICLSKRLKNNIFWKNSNVHSSLDGSCMITYLKN